MRQNVLKVVLAGDLAVGKTSLRRRFMGAGFEGSHQATLGADFAMKRIQLDDVELKLQIWDLAGHDAFETVRGLYYGNASGIIIVYDKTRPDTFQHLPKWVDEAWTSSGKGPLPTMVLANKEDLDSLHKVKDTRGSSFVEELNTSTEHLGFDNQFLTTSALTGFQVEEAFVRIARTMLKNEETRYREAGQA